MSSPKRKRDVPVLFWVSADEMELIQQKMAQFGTKNLSAYLRKMAVDGYVVQLDLPELKEHGIIMVITAQYRIKKRIRMSQVSIQTKDGTPHYVTADEYLSGNVRRKLRQAQRAAQQDPIYAVNVEALTAAQPKDLDASEIEVRLGATWIDKEYIQQFMYETFNTPFYLQRSIGVNYSSFTAEWQIKGKSSVSYNDVAAYTTYGTSRANAYKILEAVSYTHLVWNRCIHLKVDQFLHTITQFHKTFYLSLIHIFWALPGSTKSTSSSLCTKPSTPRFISSAVSRSTIRPLPLNGRSRGNLLYPTTMWQLIPPMEPVVPMPTRF